MRPTRRQIIVWLRTALAVARCGRPPDAKEPLKALTEAQASALDAYADEVLPPDGSALQIARYVDRLLSDTEPFIGSDGLPVPLDRVAKAGWALRVKALKEQLEPILASGKKVVELGPDDRELVCSLVTEGAFSRPEYGGNEGGGGWKLVGSAGAVMPRGFVQWDGAQNVERAEAPVSTREPGVDPHPLDQSTRDLLDEVTRATGGKIAP